jgi:hypothetical protein
MSKILGIKILVFGSPVLRRNSDDLNAISDVFSELDLRLSKSNIDLSIEPNSPIYGGKFFFTTSEISTFIEENGFLRIKTMIDTHNLELQGFNPFDEFEKNFNNINHVHISKINLDPILVFDEYKNLFDCFSRMDYKKTATLEIKESDFSISSIENFSKFFYKS